MKKFKDFIKDSGYTKFFTSSKAMHPDDDKNKKKEKSEYTKFFSSAKIKVDENHIIEKTDENIDYEKIGADIKRHSQILSDHYSTIKAYTGIEHALLNKSLHASNGTFKSLSPEHHLHKFDKSLSKAIKSVKTSHGMKVYSGMRSPENIKKDKTTGMLHMHHPAYMSTSLHDGSAHDFASRRTHEGHMTSHIYWQSTPSNHATPIKPGEKFSPKKHGKYYTRTSEGLFVSVNPKVDGHGHRWSYYSHILETHVPAGSHAAHVQHLSQYPEEQEVVLHKNCKIHIHPKPKVDHKSKTVTWTGHLVHDGVKKTSLHP